MVHVRLICGKELRVRVDDPAYRRDANCTFLKQLRCEGAIYKVAPSAITLVCRDTKCYYNIKPRGVTAAIPIKNMTLTRVCTNDDDEDDDKCILCLVKEKQMVAAPCGHYTLCTVCSVQMCGKPCLLCQMPVTEYVDYNKLL
ncbi:IAP-4 [Epiphyas postvittana nucleopolyhedrovirus]|uniref:IAP-4 n=1 Tax=Epiphyas postvittana nucleopolyhedrovirus TaxID=70600 RepID=Q9YKL4_NPVEP|nr:IAP-4 [Epiphyas postvittana nucleopolyhedrovirus]AAD19699.1 apoptosis inhibitor iap-4 [Epiphyas postvittana nucleopolyhedrovirus]AAK85656.1 IAP-4 [Epiphyas postvittana nucleopolyhedrovirus]